MQFKGQGGDPYEGGYRAGTVGPKYKDFYETYLEGMKVSQILMRKTSSNTGFTKHLKKMILNQRLRQPVGLMILITLLTAREVSA